ncbi:MAG: hypothetical protein HWD61_02045 [Parachlamydiaceae bacterium]|nr:MAG: hypothetical protein HWD61_02045 [Parachlamydiaceae bacterium]
MEFLSEAKTDISQLIASLHIFNDSKMTDANRPYSTIEHQENSSSDRELYTMLPNLNPFDDELYANEFDSKWNENSNLENMVAPERIKKTKTE